MKRTIIPAGLALLALSGCGSHAATSPPPSTPHIVDAQVGNLAPATTAAPAPTVARTAARPTPTTMSDESIRNLAFHSYAADQGWNFAAAKRVATATCELLDTGVQLDDALYYLAASGDIDSSNAAMAGRVIGAGITAYCPEHQGQIDRLSR